MINITKREDLSKQKGIIIRIAAIILSILFTGIFINLLGYNSIDVFYNMVTGALGSEMRLQKTIVKAIPIAVASLGILVAFKMKFWNIGGEGQIMMGAMAATFVALNLDGFPRALTLVLMMLAAFFFGAVWAFIPAFFKVKCGTNETIFTLMMNYIAIKWITYLQFGPWKDPNAGGFPKIATYPDNAVLPEVFGINIGWIITIIAAVIVYIFMNHTKKGYEISVVGESLATAKYAGMNVKMVIITAMLVSGGLCGLTGMIMSSSIEKTLTIYLSNGIGYTAIITAWLSGLSAPFAVISSFAFAVLIQGGKFIQIALQVPASVADMIQGMILFFVLGSEFFTRYKISFKGQKGGEK
ncbi:ABC transporter permease [Anaerovorax odorimutans]|uniref:ABC transporter permease n=1 Tax=Anaerovorax odorimutans TaxID=109327 RepID=UPI000408BEB7|nr:ABC transporter permease [Anaerovorax odorimutans]